MGRQESSLQEALGVFSRIEDPRAPLTASEVAEELDCSRRTAYNKLEELAEQGELETKKVGARGRVWWRPVQSEQFPESDAESVARTGIEHAQFDELVDAVRDYAIFVLDADGVVQTWNRGARQLKGYEESEIVGEHFSTFYTEEDRDAGRPDRNLEMATEEGRIEDEGWRVQKDGSQFWAQVTITALRDNDGELRGFTKITRDMTERHAYEERLRTEKERFETLVQEVKDYAIFLLDEDGTVQTWNDGARRLKGYDEEEIVGEHVSTFYTEGDREASRPENNLRKAADAGRVKDEGQRVRKDGTTFWANVVITALYDEDGSVRGYAKVTRDMTDRHEYEKQLRSQRDELDELDRINAVIRDIDQTLVSATTRSEIEQEVCDRLAASDTYTAAWVGEYSSDHSEITPRTWSNVGEEYLERIRVADTDADGEGTERGVGVKALETQTIQPVQQLRGDHDGEPRRGSSVEAGDESAIAVPLVYNEVEYGVLTVYAEDESAFDQRKVAVMGELGETISHAIAAIRRKEREQALTTLQEATLDLLHTETRSEIGDVIVEALTDDFALEDAVVYHFDTTENTLDPVSSSFQADAYGGHLTPLTAGTDSPVWTSFMEGESRMSDSVLPSREMGSRRTRMIPLGDHGVLAVAAAERETFDENTRQLVDLVATTAESAFDRVESQANLRERDELLQEQNQRLQRLNQINTIIREVDQGVVQATTREEIQRVVCERLTENDRFRFAWIGSPDGTGEGLSPETWSGDGHGYLDSVDLSDGVESGRSEPALTAQRTGEIAVISNVAEELRGGDWRREAFSREFQSVVGVPLRYGDVTYGVLTVYADRPEAFGEMERSVFEELGETIANAMNAVETKQALVTDSAVELEFVIPGDDACFLARLAGQIGCEVSFEGMLPLSENRGRVFFVVHGSTPAELRDVLDRTIAVESNEIIAAHDDEHLVEAVVAGPIVALTLLEYGASLRTLEVTGNGVELTVELPSNGDTRSFIERFQARYENAEFVARRERERPLQTREGLSAELEDRLTDRQLEVLQTAYYSGFFDSPRKASGSDVAELLDVSQPTVSEQLRTAQRKVLDLLVTDADVDIPTDSSAE